MNVHRPAIALGRYFPLDELTGTNCEDLGLGHDLTLAAAAAAPTWVIADIAYPRSSYADLYAAGVY